MKSKFKHKVDQVGMLSDSQTIKIFVYLLYDIVVHNLGQSCTIQP